MAVSAKVRHSVLTKYPSCLACGSTHRLNIDHVVSKVLGGGDGEENLQTLCSKCNNKKRGSCVDYRVTPPVLIKRFPLRRRHHFKITSETHFAMTNLIEKTGKGKTAILEDAIRFYAGTHNVKTSDAPPASSSKETPATVHEQREGDKSG